MKAVVFDMDGVLFDTEKLCMDSWLHVASVKGITDMKEVFGKCIGLNANDTRQVVFGHYGDSFPYDEFRTEASAWFWKHIEREGIPVKKGVQKILPYLQQSGIRIGLASSTNYTSVIDQLKRADIIDYFQVIVTGDMIEHSKPRPDIYLLACRKLDAPPEEAYAIEDSPNGIRAAYEAGMKPVMIPDLLAPDGEMEEMSYLICDNLVEFMRFLNK